MTRTEADYCLELETTVKRLRHRMVFLTHALTVAKKAIRDWQQIDAGNLADEEIWQLYQSSPEMTTINAVLAVEREQP